MVTFRRGLAVGLLALGLPWGLSGCTYGTWHDAFVPTDCDVETARRLDKAAWDEADVVSVRIRQGEYVPMLIELETGRPYILRLLNGDDDNHVFRSKEFFANVSMAGVARGADEMEHVCFTSLLVPPGKSTEMRFVPLRDGHYDFFDANLPTVFPGSSSGVVIVR